MTFPEPADDMSTPVPDNAQHGTIQQQHRYEIADSSANHHPNQPSGMSLTAIASSWRNQCQSAMDSLTSSISFILLHMRTPCRPAVSTVSNQAMYGAHFGDEHRSQGDPFDSSKSIRQQLVDLTRDIRNPTCFWIPCMSVYAIIYFTLRTVENQQTSNQNGQPFKESCPENGRRTQAAVVVKLFAATVTTIAINGHLGSLTGSDSWRRELVRAFEVLIIPLAPLFHFANRIFFEIALLFSNRTWLWHESVSIRYRLARACQCRISGAAVMRMGSLDWAVNPKHTMMVTMPLDLRWFGRVFMVTVLLGQVSSSRRNNPG